MGNQLPSLQIVCPVYNEQEVIQLFHGALYSTLSTIENRYQWRILYVVDRSSDDTMKILKKFSEEDKRIQIISAVNTNYWCRWWSISISSICFKTNGNKIYEMR